ncbi:hypothetical protein [uncultured Methanobrevibacter sp.]|uniref:hypothetical protein n=1 Tax=uncultured Methanobrevibacter sp. TaxID=253161 RepID=UPI0025EB8CBD|nr:hypothetical protein [uncultured Methanobrevibacter sp.]
MYIDENCEYGNFLDVNTGLSCIWDFFELLKYEAIREVKILTINNIIGMFL